MHLKARLSNLKVSPRKTRLVIDLVRGKSVAEAERILTFTPKISAAPILKLIKSAVANVEAGSKIPKADLFIKSITATPGVTLKRYRPRAYGRAMTIRKRWTRVQLELGSEKETTPAAKSKGKAGKESLDQKAPALKTVTDVSEVKKLTAKNPLALHGDHASETKEKQANAGQGDKRQFKQRKTGGE